MIVDLSSSLHDGMIYPHSSRTVSLNLKAVRVEEDEVSIMDGSGYGSGAGYVDTKCDKAFTEVYLESHHGTHVDAPAHTQPDGKTIDQYPLSKFINNTCQFIDLSSYDLSDPRGIPKKILEAVIPADCSVSALVFATGVGNPPPSYSYFSPSGAMYLMDRFKGLQIIGVDSWSVDPSGDDFPAHRLFFNKDVLPLEGLVNLKSLPSPPKIFKLHCAPLSYVGADAAQVRAYAEW